MCSLSYFKYIYIHVVLVNLPETVLHTILISTIYTYSYTHTYIYVNLKQKEYLNTVQLISVDLIISSTGLLLRKLQVKDMSEKTHINYLHYRILNNKSYVLYCFLNCEDETRDKKR